MPMAQQYRWGGLAALGGALLFVYVFIFVGVVVGADASIDGFPPVRAGRTIENGLYLAVLVLWVAPMLVLHEALRDTSPGTARYASVVGVLGLTMLAAGALPHAANVGIADLYHAPGGTEAERAALAAVWEGNQGIANMLLVTGLAIVPIGVLGLGLAMRRSSTFGTHIGSVGIGMGAIGLIAAVVLLVDPLSPVAVSGFFALIAFNAVVGWRLYSLSRGRVQQTAPTATVTGRSVG
jgi:hypothetical protein